LNKEMSRQVDKLFKDKLENHSIPPAPQSWEKIHARISKKNRVSIVLKVAAAIAVAGLLLTVVFNQNQNSTPSPALTKEDVKPTTGTQLETPVLRAESSAAVATGNSKKIRVQTNPQEVSEIIIEPEATPVPELVVNVTPEQEAVIDVIQPEPMKTRKMVLVYTLPSPARKAPAPEEEQKKTGLQKVMDVAMEVRSNDNALGGLREAKDELFALEFRKDKNKTKN